MRQVWIWFNVDMSLNLTPFPPPKKYILTSKWGTKSHKNWSELVQTVFRDVFLAGRMFLCNINIFQHWNHKWQNHKNKLKKKNKYRESKHQLQSSQTNKYAELSLQKKKTTLLLLFQPVWKKSKLRNKTCMISVS